MDRKRIQELQATIQGYYRAHGRHDLPWRIADKKGIIDPYRIVVSEVMLQQTQVPRVIPKFLDFIEVFPTPQALGEASLADILRLWSGLGYNRRAKFLWEAAQGIVDDHHGIVPDTVQELVRLPGIGVNTASAIVTYAYNKPVAFIETNIRTVFIYHFFADQERVDDKMILDIVAASIPDNPREWFWAVMDYGAHLKETVGNLNIQSKHYTIQSRFAGSKRQLRGRILRDLAGGPKALGALTDTITDERLTDVLDDLVHEGLISFGNEHYNLPGA